MDTSPAETIRYFLTYRGVRLPLTLAEELQEADLRNRNTYFRAGYDGAGRVRWLEKCVYGEVELRHDYQWSDDGRLLEAGVWGAGEDEPRRMQFAQA